MDVYVVSVDIASVIESLDGIDLRCMFGFLNSVMDDSVDIASVDVSLDELEILCTVGFLKVLNSVLVSSVEVAYVAVCEDVVDVLCLFGFLISVSVGNYILVPSLSTFRSHFPFHCVRVVYATIYF